MKHYRVIKFLDVNNKYIFKKKSSIRFCIRRKERYDSRLKPIRACALMWGISRTGIWFMNVKIL